MKMGSQIQFPREKWRETKEGKKIIHQKISGRIFPNIIKTQFVLKIRK